MHVNSPGIGPIRVRRREGSFGAIRGYQCGQIYRMPGVRVRTRGHQCGVCHRFPAFHPIPDVLGHHVSTIEGRQDVDVDAAAKACCVIADVAPGILNKALPQEIECCSVLPDLVRASGIDLEPQNISTVGSIGCEDLPCVQR